MALSETELAWVAGFFDGEGWSGNQQGSLRAAISQIEKEPLDRVQMATGLGQVRENKSATSTCLWCWTVNGNDTQKFFDLIWPYLDSVKKMQAKRAIARVKWFKLMVKPSMFKRAWETRYARYGSSGRKVQCH